jgi:hypothetical protein
MPRKAKAAPAPPPAAEPPPFDTHALIAKLRAGDDRAIEEAYRLTFGSEWGRFVLAHIAAEAGVGQRFGGEASAVELAFHQGRHDGAIDILNRAHFDPASTVTMVMTGRLEGSTDEQSAIPNGYAEADPELTD